MNNIIKMSSICALITLLSACRPEQTIQTVKRVRLVNDEVTTSWHNVYGTYESVNRRTIDYDISISAFGLYRQIIAVNAEEVEITKYYGGYGRWPVYREWKTTSEQTK